MGSVLRLELQSLGSGCWWFDEKIIGNLRWHTPHHCWRSHPGEEFVYVLEGTLDLHTLQYQPSRLNAGDSILFDAVMPHAYVAVGDKDAVLLMSNTVPADIDG